MSSLLPKTWSAVAATVALSAVAIATPQAAHAISFYLEPAGVTSQPTWVGLPTTQITFNGRANTNVPAPPMTIATNPTNGNATIQRVTGNALYTNLSTPLGSDYLNIGSNFTGPPANPNGLNLNGPGEVRLNFDAPKGLGYFGLFWATPSVTDIIVFSLRNADGTDGGIQTFNAGTVFGNLVGNTSGRYVNFFATHSDPRVIVSVRLRDNSMANSTSFEVDNIAYQQIPTPALLPGLVGLSFGVIRKRKAEAESEA